MQQQKTITNGKNVRRSSRKQAKRQRTHMVVPRAGLAIARSLVLPVQQRTPQAQPKAEHKHNDYGPSVSDLLSAALHAVEHLLRTLRRNHRTISAACSPATPQITKPHAITMPT